MWSMEKRETDTNLQTEKLSNDDREKQNIKDGRGMLRWLF